MSSKFKKDEKPTKWYTFHSDKSDRDYYYEPNSKVVTWIRPAELHTHPVVPETPKQQEESVTERRVSFHSSVDQEVMQDRSIDAAGFHAGQNVKSEDTQRVKRIPLLVVILLLCTVVVTASYMGWLPRGPLGSMFFGETVPKTSESPPKKVDRTAQKRDHGISEKGSIQKKESTMEGESTIKDANHGRIKTPVMSTESIVEKKHAKDESEQRHHTPPKARSEERQQDKKERTDQIREMASRRHEAHRQPPTKKKTEVPRRKKGCMIPFAHVFSRDCRKMLAQRPVYDMDALLDSLI